MMQLEQDIFSIHNDTDFERVALKVYHHQVENCGIYRDYVEQLNWKSPSSIREIPFLPISFFKTHRVADEALKIDLIFKSSGTGGNRSQHFVHSTELYKRAFRQIYNEYIGETEKQVILALLPNYLEQGDSSLVYMVDDLIKRTNNPLSGFVLDDMSGLLERINAAKKEGSQVILFGVAYSLLDLCDLKPDLSDCVVIETGGMKGRRKEMTKNELHKTLRDGLSCDRIFSEYGMTELLSQAYSNANGIFETCAWMKVMIRETNDPFTYVEDGKTGGINVIDLMNLHSCSFISTQDLGKITPHGFEIMGRFDHSDVRGCNLLVQ